MRKVTLGIDKTTITKKSHKLFAFRDPTTGLYWNGDTRYPDHFNRNRMGWKVAYRYSASSNFWLPTWSKIPIIFREKHVELRDMRYHLDLQYFPKDSNGNEIPAKLERVEFEGKFVIETRELVLDESIEVSSSFTEFDEAEMNVERIRLCLNGSISHSYKKLIEKGVDLTEYDYAVRIKNFVNYKKQHIPFEYHQYAGITFLQSEADVIVAMMLFGKDMSSSHCLIDIKPKFILT